MPKTLLAVDDSVTMRKVIEMTFAGEDMRVVTVATAKEAVAFFRASAPDAVLADVSLEQQSGYDLCRSLKDENRNVPVILLSSKQNPYDPARGQACGADEHIDKPYDTGKAIDLVKRILTAGRSVAPTPITASAAAAPKPLFQPPAQPIIAPTGSRSPAVAPEAARPAPHVAAPPAPHPAPVPHAAPVAHSSAVVGHAPPVAHPAPVASPMAHVAHAPPPVAHPAPTPHAIAASAPLPPLAVERPAAPAPAAPSNGVSPLPADLASKLHGLGLTPTQVEAVVGLSREVVERVVWEIVPVLAETMIREEIARLTRE